MYYLLGGNKEQLSVWHGQEIWLYDSCLNLNAGRVYMYPFEYNTFLGGLARVSTAISQQNPVEGTKRFHIADHLGSVRVAIDPAGARTELDYEPFGKATVAQFTVDVPRQTFIDKEKDGENGLGDFGVRKYEEETGRFMSVDPLWEVGRALSPYHYGYNSPLISSDPTGLVGPDPNEPDVDKKLDEESSAGAGGMGIGRYSAGEAAAGVKNLVKETFTGIWRWVTGGGSATTTTSPPLTPPAAPATSPAAPPARPPLVGNNPRNLSGKTINTDLPGGRATAKSVFRNRTKGQEVKNERSADGSPRRKAADGTQIRMKDDGSTVVDVPIPAGRGASKGQSEAIHFSASDL